MQLVRTEYLSFKKTERSKLLKALARVRYQIVRFVVCKVALGAYLDFPFQLRNSTSAL